MRRFLVLKRTFTQQLACLAVCKYAGIVSFERPIQDFAAQILKYCFLTCTKLSQDKSKINFKTKTTDCNKLSKQILHTSVRANCYEKEPAQQNCEAMNMCVLTFCDVAYCKGSINLVGISNSQRDFSFGIEKNSTGICHYYSATMCSPFFFIKVTYKDHSNILPAEINV